MFLESFCGERVFGGFGEVDGGLCCGWVFRVFGGGLCCEGLAGLAGDGDVEWGFRREGLAFFQNLRISESSAGSAVL